MTPEEHHDHLRSAGYPDAMREHREADIELGWLVAGRLAMIVSALAMIALLVALGFTFRAAWGLS
ncbi:MAG TPA: hypothetical protein PKI99_09400 [Terrimesophilobacter sp.]|nr:hypothetical protein [Terrimesophilobacter sp.]